jgi:transcriptional regulator with XRE-family HTH domain
MRFCYNPRKKPVSPGLQHRETSLVKGNKMEKYFQTLGTLLKKSRVQAGLSQDDVAKKLGYGSYQFISNWERGISSPPCKILKKIQAIYGVPASKLYKVLLSDSIARVEQQLAAEFKKSK